MHIGGYKDYKRAISLAVTVFAATLLATSQASAAVASAGTVANTANGCAVTEIHLHGTNPPTMTCLLRRAVTNGGKVSPNTGIEGNCSDPAVNFTTIWHDGYGNRYLDCYAGSGYIGVYDPNTTWVGGGGYFTSWIKYYDSNYPNGVYSDVLAGEGYNFPNALLTQICDQCGP